MDYVYDANENLVEVVDDANPSLVYWQAVSVNDFGEVTSELLGNNVITTRIFDPNTGTLENEQSVSGSTSLEDKTYSWDQVGNLQSRTDGVHGTAESFTYDDLNRLTQAALSGTQVTASALTLSYDKVGNITCKSDVVGSACAPGSTNYSYDPAHPLQISAITPASGPVRTFQYDTTGGTAGNGNLVSDGVHSFTAWDADNRPTQVSNSTTGASETIAYTPDGMRYQGITTTGSGTDTLTEINPLFQVLNDGTDTYYQEMISAGGNAVAVRTLASNGTATTLTTRYLIHDHLGSATLQTNESGALTCETAYDAFGNPRDPATGQPTTQDCAGNGKGYTDQMSMTGIGLVHMNGRVYDPQVGRMVSADPTVPDPFYSQSFNRYAYVYNNLRISRHAGRGFHRMAATHFT